MRQTAVPPSLRLAVVHGVLMRVVSADDLILPQPRVRAPIVDVVAAPDPVRHFSTSLVQWGDRGGR